MWRNDGRWGALRGPPASLQDQSALLSQLRLCNLPRPLPTSPTVEVLPSVLLPTCTLQDKSQGTYRKHQEAA